MFLGSCDGLVEWLHCSAALQFLGHRRFHMSRLFLRLLSYVTPEVLDTAEQLKDMLGPVSSVACWPWLGGGLPAPHAACSRGRGMPQQHVRGVGA